MENPLTQKSGSRLSVIALLLFVVSFLAVWFYIMPQWETVQALETTRNELRDQRKATNDKLVELQTLQQELNQASEVTRETTLNAIPEKLDQDGLIRELSRLAQRNDMILNNMNFSIPRSSEGSEVTPVQVNVNVTGSEGKLIEFLKSIETSSRKMLVRNITIQLGEETVGARVNFNLSIEAYYQGQI